MVWRLRGDAKKDNKKGKFMLNWERPFRVAESLQNDVYRLQDMARKVVPKTWNATHLRSYYS